ncbi:MAG: TMEM165/GDT1 family protein, partial [Hyphomicrobiales bacterium]|nr:TMEM165/GDT1 family protein [Hyphomicrobiales bacterium]
MSIDWLHAGPTLLASFLASFVEFVEALTVVLAVGTVRGWRDALGGSGAALVALLVIIAVLGPALTLIPLESVQLVVGGLLLLFGMRWLRKAVLRAAGIIALHDEAEAFAKETDALRSKSAGQDFDKEAFLTSFNGVFIEGVEVVFIVLALGV